jgi:hypothetical protein
MMRSSMRKKRMMRIRASVEELLLAQAQAEPQVIYHLVRKKMKMVIPTRKKNE